MTLQHYENSCDTRTVGERFRELWEHVGSDIRDKVGPREELEATMRGIRAAADLTLDVSGVRASDLIHEQRTEAPAIVLQR